MTDTANPNNNQVSIKQLESLLELYLVQKAPALPENVKEFIVKYSPYISIIMMIAIAPMVLAIIGIGTIAMPFSYLGGIRSGLNFSFSYIFLIGQLILEIVALPGLFKRAQSAWRLMFYATLANFVYSILGGNLINGLVSALISAYILFQIKSLYKN